MNFKTHDQLTEEQVNFGLKAIIKDGLCTQTMETLTRGVFLSIFALKLGASNTFIGLLAAIPALAQIFHIPSIFLVEKVKNRRAICVFGSGISRFFWFFVAIIPVFFMNQVGLYFLLFILFINQVLASISGVSWISWMKDLIPQNQLGLYFSKRMKLSMVLGIVLSVGVALFMDFWKKWIPEYEMYSYSFLFFFGAIAGLLGVYYLYITPEPKMNISDTNISFFKTLKQPFLDTNFKNLIKFSVTWNFALNIAGPFFTVFMVKKLDLGFTYIIFFTIISQLMNVFFFKIWGRYADKYSNKSVLRISGILYILSVLVWIFTRMPEKHLFTIPLLIVVHIFMGISTAGVSLATGTIGLKLAPQTKSTAFLAVKGFSESISAFIAPLLGGKLADFLTGYEVSLILKWKSPLKEILIPTIYITDWDFYFLITFIIGLYAMHLLSQVKEEGEVNEIIVVSELTSELRSNIKNFSTIGGMYNLALFPLNLVKKIVKK